MIRIVSVLIFSSLLTSCWESDPNIDFALPHKTQEGKNTFGCLLNGRVWTNHGRICYPFLDGCHENLTAIYRSANNEGLNLYADRVLRKNGSLVSSETIGFFLNGAFKAVGSYSLRYIDNVSDISYYDRLTENSYGCLPDRETFTLQITRFDTLNKIISGEFSGTLFNITYNPLQQRPATDSIIISEGRFDVKLK